MKPMDHGSDQTLSPVMHQKTVDKYNAEIRRRNKQPVIPNPRYELMHSPAHVNDPLPGFLLTYNAQSPSAALQTAHRFVEQLGLACDFHDKFTNERLCLSHLAMDED